MPRRSCARARVVSLSQSFDTNGPQKGWRRRTNPVHTMTDTGVDAERGNQGFPHGIGGADDVIAMPLQCSTQWDGLGHIFDHGMAWNGRRAGDVVTSEGDLVTGIEHAASVIVSRGVLLDVGRHLRPESRRACPTATPSRPPTSRRTIAAQGASSDVGRGDIVLVRTGQLARARRDGWGDYAGGPAPGLSLTTAGWLHRTEIAAIATDTWGFEVRPNEFDAPAFQPLHQVVIPNLGLTIGEMWDLEALGAACAASGRYDFLLSAAPLPDHRRRRLAHQPRRDPLTANPNPNTKEQRGSDMTAVNKVAIAGSGVAGLAAAIQLAKAGVTVDVFEAKPELSALGSGISLQGNALRVFDALGAWDDIRAAGYPFEGLNLRAPGPDAPIVADLPDVKTGGPDYPAAMGMPRPDARPHPARARAARRCEHPLRHEGHRRRHAGGRRRRGVRRRPVGRRIRPADRRRRPALGRARPDRHRAPSPQPTGMGIWRTFVSRPAEVVRSELYYGGPVYIAGYTPTGEDSMYAFLVEKAEDRFGTSDEDATRIMLEESRAYGGPWNSIRADLEAGAHANYTWFTTHMVEGPGTAAAP